MRLFAALWPTPEVRAHLAAALRTTVGVDPETSPGLGPQGVRWTAAECWHLTLAFYGDVTSFALYCFNGRLSPCFSFPFLGML